MWTMISNYYKVLENKKIYKKNSSKYLEMAEKLKDMIINGGKLETITFVRNEWLNEIVIDYIIISIIMEYAKFIANKELILLWMWEYITWFWEYPEFNNNKILIADVRNLYVRKPLEQENFLLKLLTVFNTRKASNLLNILILNYSLKDLIKWNDFLNASIKNTILIK